MALDRCPIGGHLFPDGLAAEWAVTEIARLRFVLAAIDQHSVNTIRTKSRDVGDWIEDMGFVGKLARGH